MMEFKHKKSTDYIILSVLIKGLGTSEAKKTKIHLNHPHLNLAQEYLSTF